MAIAVDKTNAPTKQAKACAQAMPIAAQLLPTAKRLPKATKHLPTLGNCPLLL
jgi:hypothetical protein